VGGDLAAGDGVLDAPADVPAGVVQRLASPLERSLRLGGGRQDNQPEQGGSQ
jgi:hypothetical protein